MPDGTTVDLFTIADRREAIRQGVLLDNLSAEFKELKAFIKDTIIELHRTIGQQDTKIRQLEDFKIVVQASIKTTLWWCAVVGSLAGAVVNMLMSYVFNRIQSGH